MHEMSIVQALFDQIEREVDQSGHSGRVLQIHLVIGRLSGVHVDAIRFAYELLSPDSIASQAQLVIDQPRAVLRCTDCRLEQEIDELTVICPSCGGSHVTIEGGQQLLLQSIELED